LLAVLPITKITKKVHPIFLVFKLKIKQLRFAGWTQGNNFATNINQLVPRQATGC
jgi:hypothetical protein